MIEEARLERIGRALAPAGDGWFVLNLADAPWLRHDDFGLVTDLEGATRFPQVGIKIRALLPGQPNGLYHAETAQEDVLVLSGECLLLVEGEERVLRAWDFVHLPAGTEHIVVGAGDGPCAILMVGARPPDHAIRYPVSEVALQHGAGAEAETTSADEAYAAYGAWSEHELTRDRLPWT